MSEFQPTGSDDLSKFTPEDPLARAQRLEAPTSEAKREDAKSLAEKMNVFFRSPIMRVAGIMLSLTMLTRSSRVESAHVEDTHRDMPAAEIIMKGGSEIDFTSWDDIRLDSVPKVRIAVPEEVQKSIDYSELEEYVGFKKDNIKDPASFKNFVQKQAANPTRLAELGHQSVDELSSKELVELSALIVADNLNYSNSENSLLPEGLLLKELEKSAAEPIDQVLMNPPTTDCTHYSAATEAVFNELKSEFPDKLANVYVGSMASIDDGHAWNKVFFAESPTKFTLSYIDATAPDYAQPEKYLGVEDVNDYLEGIKHLGIININEIGSTATK